MKVSADFENAENKFNERLQIQLEVTMKEAEVEKKTAVAQVKKDMESLVENMKAERDGFEELYLKVRFFFFSFVAAIYIYMAISPFSQRQNVTFHSSFECVVPRKSYIYISNTPHSTDDDATAGKFRPKAIAQHPCRFAWKYSRELPCSTGRACRNKIGSR
jgi:hypothetical protein